jgi:hypothetical protein
VTTLREALQAEGILEQELQYYATDDQLTEAKERIAAQQKEIERLRDIELSQRTTINELDNDLQRERNTASAAWATADQLKDELESYRGHSADPMPEPDVKLPPLAAWWATPEERANLIKDRDWWREAAQKNVLIIEQLRGEIANLRKANNSFADAFTLRPALIQATVLVLAYEAGHLWDETAKDFIVEHSGADWLAEAQTQFERNLGADDEPQGMQMDDDPEFNPSTEERGGGTAAQATAAAAGRTAGRCRDDQGRHSRSAVHSAGSQQADGEGQRTNAARRAGHDPADRQGNECRGVRTAGQAGAERQAHRRCAGGGGVPVLPPLQERVQSLEDGKGTARRFAAVGQRIDAVMDAHNGAIDRIKKLETSVAELSLSPVYGPLPSGMSGQPAR